MIAFIENGLDLSEELKEDYAKRSAFHKNIVDFFHGVEKERKSSVAGYLSIIWNEFDINSDNALDALEIKVMLEHFTEENVETEEIIQFLQESARAEGNGSLRRDVILKMILDGHKLSTNQRDEYANKGKIYRLLLAFYDVFQYRALSKAGEVASSKTFLHNSDSPDTTGKDNIDSKEPTKKPDVEELGEKVGTYVNKIVKKYNRTRTGFLSPNETQVMLQHYTGIQVSLKDITDFLKSNNDSSNGQASIGENDLRDIIQRGISLSPKERENYISQGQIYDVLIQFFDGVAREMKTLNRPIANFMEQVWHMFDADGDEKLDTSETKALLEYFTGHTVSEENVNSFLSSIDENGDTIIQKSELIAFIENGLDLSEELKEDYAKRSAFHKNIVDFFHGVEKERKSSVAGYLSII